ncbi:MAG: hypothetical protein ILO53_08715 [Clostridia bacterium]|nr:hypothetical protein [Clostridia bacterium]
MVIEVGGKTFYASLEDNPSAKALIEKLSPACISVDMEDYGGFEKVGALPWELPRSDSRMTAKAGDVILYQGNQITIYYGENTWDLTRLAVIGSPDKNALQEALGSGGVTVSFSLEWSE